MFKKYFNYFLNSTSGKIYVFFFLNTVLLIFLNNNLKFHFVKSTFNLISKYGMPVKINLRT